MTLGSIHEVSDGASHSNATTTNVVLSASACANDAFGAIPDGAASISAEEWLEHGKELVDNILTDTFNSVLRIEERSLNNRLTEGLSIAELHTIVAVGLHEKNPMKVVAARLDVTLATLTASMTKLERKGYVQRTRGEVDRRQVLVELTLKGRKAFRAHEAFHKKLVDSALEGLSPEEEVVLYKALAKVKYFFDQENEVAKKASSR